MQSSSVPWILGQRQRHLVARLLGTSSPMAAMSDISRLCIWFYLPKFGSACGQGAASYKARAISSYPATRHRRFEKLVEFLMAPSFWPDVFVCSAVGTRCSRICWVLKACSWWTFGIESLPRPTWSDHLFPDGLPPTIGRIPAECEDAMNDAWKQAVNDSAVATEAAGSDCWSCGSPCFF